MKKYSLLSVDDNPIDLDIIRKMLESDYNVYVATNTCDMVVILERENIDLILMDVLMPDIDGFQAVEMLKKSKFSDIPIIMVSATTEFKDEFKGFEIGAVDFIRKPFKKEFLKRRIELHLALNRNKHETQKFKECLEI